jgi:hypothetical protein
MVLLLGDAQVMVLPCNCTCLFFKSVYVVDQSSILLSARSLPPKQFTFDDSNSEGLKWRGALLLVASGPNRTCIYKIDQVHSDNCMCPLLTLTLTPGKPRRFILSLVDERVNANVFEKRGHQGNCLHQCQ